MKKILFFFPHNPNPPKSGAHKRCIELLNGLKKLGCQVVLASSTYTSEEPWTDASIEAIRKELGCNVMLHSPGPIETRLTLLLNRVRSVTHSTGFFNWIINHILRYGGFPFSLISVGMKRWFNRVVKEFQPDVIFMNYAYFDCILSRGVRMRRVCVMEMHDLVTINAKMRTAIREAAELERLDTVDTPQSTLDLDFFQNRGFTADKFEFDIYNKYNYTTCISKHERVLVQQNALRTRALYIPMTIPIFPVKNTFGGGALFTSGPNPFNLQGYYFFIEKVLPLIKIRLPDFHLVVTGKFPSNFVPQHSEYVTFKGFVDDLSQLYENSCFFICPVFGGTGLQVKIIEAMANGLPVVVLENAGNVLPLIHGENGMIARNAEEFAEHILTLWADRDLCRRIGEEARKTVANEYGQNRLLEGLAQIVTG